MQQEYTQPVRKDNFVLYALLVIGVLGLVFVKLSPEPNANKKGTTLLYIQEDKSSQESAKQNALASNTELDSRLITTNLQPEAHRPFTFKMEGFSSGAEYMLDLGDGNMRTFVRGELTYSYPRKGKYTVKLISKNEKETRILQSNEVKVAPAPEYDEMSEITDYSVK